ncbi:hypothetical protein DRP04_14055 [Archaeoglobales archaeon]|nr:MAG: hypothetical protein DRP04_14055 [Archaeoglobales archaeon]
MDLLAYLVVFLLGTGIGFFLTRNLLLAFIFGLIAIMIYTGFINISINWSKPLAAIKGVLP